MTFVHKNNDKTFSIILTTSDFTRGQRAFSDGVDFLGFKWNLQLVSLNNDLRVLLACSGNNSNSWSVTVKTTSYLQKSDGSSPFQQFETMMDCGKKFAGTFSIKNANLNDYIVNDAIKITCTIEIQAICGNHPQRKYNFAEKDEKLSDLALMVEDKPLYVNKATLACFSPVFCALFNSDFKEKNKASITLPEDNYAEMEQFLQLLYHCNLEIHKLNVEGLLRLADKYDTPMITQQCEAFLLSTDKVANLEKLRYAETYSLFGLFTKCMNSIKTVGDYSQHCVDLEKRDKKTLVNFVTIGMEIMNNLMKRRAPEFIDYSNLSIQSYLA